MKAIVSTTINPPTEALRKFIEIAHRDDWYVYIVGDRKTPHEEYLKLEDERVTYISPAMQESLYPELSKLIPWNCIQRRNFGFIEAYKDGADIIATVDDDNIPLEDWGKDVFVNKETLVNVYPTSLPVFDPLIATNTNVWHRGFPVQMINKRDRLIPSRGKLEKCLVQADLWNGDPDIDAIARIAFSPMVNLEIPHPYTSDKVMPFNSQNTFLSREIFPTYFLFPFVGRMDDIYAAYVTQKKFKNSVVFNKPTVRQDRNEHNLVKDLEDELHGYKYALNIATENNWQQYMPKESLLAYEQYKKEF